MNTVLIYISLVVMVVVIVGVCVKTLMMACEMMDGRTAPSPLGQSPGADRSTHTNNYPQGRLRARSLSSEGKTYISVAV